MQFALVLVAFGAALWQHPAGMITEDTLGDIRKKTESQAWAKNTYDTQRQALQPWLDLSSEELQRIFPSHGGNVYHNFSCPDDRVSLEFNPFNPDEFRCATCGQTFAPDADSGVYPSTERYHGNLYDGWICLFHITLTQRMVEMALMGRLEQDAGLLDRATELLMLYATRMQRMPLRPAPDLSPDLPTYRQYGSIFTYHREGDNKILFDLAQVYELLRDRMSAEQGATVEKHVIQRLLDDVMLEPIYVYDHNNVYQWHRSIVQAALALERDDIIDWSFGFGPYTREMLPEHRSMSRILATHFNEDGAFWELASGYHLYPVNHLCEFALLSHHLATMDPERFPPELYDLTRPESPGGKTIHNALAWFLSMAMPDRTMTVVGDSTRARAGMESYIDTAEIGYRYFGIEEVGDYARFREGRRSWDGLLHGAAQIVQHETPFTSSNLSSGWVSLRSTGNDNRLWVGLNALTKGGGHQHADHLSLTSYSHGELLALEKSVPYNEQTLRILGTQTQAHNTVTVDCESGPQGEDLREEQTPIIQYFHADPVVQFAEIHGDKLYPQAPVYRRAVALVEDIALDVFRVEGGTTHDWLLNHAGAAPEISIPLEPGTFQPEAWLAGGSGQVRTARTADTWTARWTVNGVTSRLTMIGAPATDIFALETYPLNNAVITPDYPPTQTLCVRRNDHMPFVAVWDAWKQSPNLRRIECADNRPDAMRVETSSHVYHVVFGPGLANFADGTHIDTDAAFTIVRGRDAATFVHGTKLRISDNAGASTIALSAPASFSGDWQGKATIVGVRGDIDYDTRGGEDHPRPTPEVEFTVSGDWLAVP